MSYLTENTLSDARRMSGVYFLDDPDDVEMGRLFDALQKTTEQDLSSLSPFKGKLYLLSPCADCFADLYDSLPPQP